MAARSDRDGTSHRTLPRPYEFVMDCSAIRADLVRRIMTEVLLWGDRYVDSVMQRLGNEEDATHSYSSHEIAETKVLQAVAILTESGEDPVGITMRPVA